MKNLYPRVLSLPRDKSFFLFGARNTGKSTLISTQFKAQSMLMIDLLKKETEACLLRRPDELFDIVMALPPEVTHVVIDEIQKVPPLLDRVSLANGTGAFFVS